MPKQRVPAPYPPEFRAEAIRLVRSGDRSVSEIAKDLGVSAQSLRNWLRQADLDEGHRHDGLTTEDRAELDPVASREPGVAQGTRDPEKSRSLLRQGDSLDPVRVFEFIHAEKANHRIAVMCRLLGVSRSGYHAWVIRAPSVRAVRDGEIGEAIAQVWERSRRTYGAPGSMSSSGWITTSAAAATRRSADAPSRTRGRPPSPAAGTDPPEPGRVSVSGSRRNASSGPKARTGSGLRTSPSNGPTKAGCISRR